VSYGGQHYQLEDALAVPIPQPTPPIMIGGDGERLTLRAVAEHADWWNAMSRPMDVLRRKVAALEEHCATVGRDPESIVRTITFVAFLDTDAGAARRAAGSRLEGEVVAFAGEPSAMIDHLATLAELGFEHVQLVFPGFPGTTDMELFLDRVRPAFA
jgi:alkanesulfonate monooxygenase SsuD/methylene tetrahydromethanopterin reductase-like flavin-dependent oxidoreductase (luciferase family)